MFPYLLISIERKAKLLTPTESDVSWRDGNIKVAVESLMTIRQSRANGTQTPNLRDPVTAGCIHTIRFIEDMP
jgi:hypothetical protein